MLRDAPAGVVGAAEKGCFHARKKGAKPRRMRLARRSASMTVAGKHASRWRQQEGRAHGVRALLPHQSGKAPSSSRAPWLRPCTARCNAGRSSRKWGSMPSRACRPNKYWPGWRTPACSHYRPWHTMRCSRWQTGIPRFSCTCMSPLIGFWLKKHGCCPCARKAQH